jgi:hypothetical protein
MAAYLGEFEQLALLAILRLGPKATCGDPGYRVAIVGCVAALLAVAVVACRVPARRASAIDPGYALRFD